MNGLSALIVVAVLLGTVWLGAGVAGQESLFGVVIPYAAITTFLLGVVYRVLRWARAPVPFKITSSSGQQTSLPWIKAEKLESPPDAKWTVARMALEILFFRSLFRNTKASLAPGQNLIQQSDRLLWLGSLAFHWSFLIIFLRHLRFFLEPVPFFVQGLERMDELFQVAVPTLFLTDVVIVAALVYLLGRRFFNPLVRYISLASDYLALYLLLGVALSGILMRYFTKVDLLAAKQLALGLVTLRPSVPEGIGLAFYVHVFFVSVLFAYFPFSKLMHMGGVFLSPTRNMPNDNRRRRHVNPINPEVEVHTYAQWEEEFKDKLEAAEIPLDGASDMTTKTPEELLQITYRPPARDWRDPHVDFEARKGSWSYPGAGKNLEYMGFPNPREWSPTDTDWKLPENWKEIIQKGFKERLGKYRSLQVFLDTCVRCGACADKCHFFLGSGDPKNMPVLRAELLRSIYRNDFTLAGKILGSLGGGRKLTEDVLKEWYYYFYQCTECRRCSVFCPYGIDTAEITAFARELMNLVGLNINWVMEPVANCHRTGNHMGIPPHTFKDNVDFLADELEEITGIKVSPSINRKGAEILFVIPSADYFADPGIYTFMGYLLLFEHIGLDYTLSAYASEGGNFGLFTSHETIKRLNYKIYAEAKRVGAKWILGGECGHMWRVLHQYMDTMNGPADFLEKPVSPLTGTHFENAVSTRTVHICEFTSDLIQHGKLKLDPSRNDHRTVTFHDSCNPARAVGLLEEPRHVLRNVCNHFHEMPENTIREETFCCAGGAGLGNDENIEMRMRGGLPRGNALRHVRDEHGVNLMACVCAIDRATLPPLAEYWAPGVEISGVHELVANALVMEGENDRKTDLRGDPLGGMEPAEDDNV